MSKEPKAPTDDAPKNTRRPRGMGGVVLILALLMALFLVVSRQGLDGQNSIHAFYSHLLNGRVEKLELADGVAKAEVRINDHVRKNIEVVVRDFLRDEQQQEIQFYNSLAALRLDLNAYPADRPDSLERFIKDVDEHRIHVLQAYFVNEVETKTPERQREDHDQRQEGCYVTALLQKDTGVQYVRLDARSQSTRNLLQVTEALRAAIVPVRTFNLSLGADEFRITEPNTALIY